MTEIQRLALTATFIAAVVSAGLAFSLVPHVELVTFLVFTAGALLGPRSGALVGALGLPLYVVANSAMRGFPPSPLPVLAAQSLGWAVVGLAGGLWRMLAYTHPRRRRAALVALPLCGVVLALFTQALLNLVYATLLGDPGGPRLAVFLSGMSFGLLDMAMNGVVFLLAGPPTASALRRLARERGWWGIALLLLFVSTPSAAQEPLDPVPGVDSLRAESTSTPRAVLRERHAFPEPLWREFATDWIPVLGHPGLLDAEGLAARHTALRSARAVRANVDRWGWGWDRLRLSMDGLDLNGRVHGLAEPPDLPKVWSGAWRERVTASGTRLDLAAPPSPGRDTRSQISLTSGSFRKRTAEFALFRNLGPVDVGVDFEDRFERGATLLGDVESSRVWLHLAAAPGRLPRFTAGATLGGEEQNLITGGRMDLGARRAYATLSGPFLGGDTRLGATVRRQRVAVTGSEELRVDGGTLQASWAAPLGLTVEAEGTVDRRRGVLAEARSFHGGFARAVWRSSHGAWRFAADAGAGHREPYGFTWEAAATVARTWESVTLTFGASHEEDLPPLVIGVDRPFPEAGLPEALELFEFAARPEARSAVRAQGTSVLGPVTFTLGAWGGRITGYRVESNPLWIFPSPYAPRFAPPREATVLGGFGEVRVQVTSMLYADGSARVSDRPLGDVPFLSQWTGEGAVHLAGRLLDTMDFDIAVGGTLVGPRENPLGDRYETTPVGWIRATGRIDNGILTFQMGNTADSRAASDLRFDDVASPVILIPRYLSLGLTLYLFD